MGRTSRDKGKRGEREVATILRGYGVNARRGVQYKGSSDSPDVIGLDGIHIEVKRTEQFRLWDAIWQSCRDSAPNDIPTVFHRKNGMPWVVVMPLDGFMQLYKEAHKDEQAAL